MSLDWVDSNADLQLDALLKARTKGPASGESEGAAGIGPLKRGIGGSKGTIVDEGEKSSRSLLVPSPQMAIDSLLFVESLSTSARVFRRSSRVPVAWGLNTRTYVVEITRLPEPNPTRKFRI